MMLQPALPRLIKDFLTEVRLAIDLQHQGYFRTIEVHNERTDDLLAAKLQPTESPAS
jgi:hypothetical protein